MPTFKDIMNLMAGQIFAGGVDPFLNSIQFSIVMLTTGGGGIF